MNQDVDFRHDIALLSGDFFNMRKQVPVKGDFQGIMIHTLLAGKTHYEDFRTGQTIEAKTPDTVTVFAVNGFEGMKIFDSSRVVLILITKDFFLNLLPEYDEMSRFADFFGSCGGLEQLTHCRASGRVKYLAEDIFFSDNSSRIEDVFRRAKALEIVYHELRELFCKTPDNISPYSAVHFSAQERAAIFQAREILLSNLSEPPSLKKLAKCVALNEFKLKVGFKRFFHQAPYQLLREERLQKARFLLEKTEMSVGQVAEAVGFQYPQNFSTAFIKRFRVQPKELRICQTVDI